MSGNKYTLFLEALEGRGDPRGQSQGQPAFVAEALNSELGEIPASLF